MAAYKVIGHGTVRPDGADKVTGRARYAADYVLPGTLWGKSLHSPHAHARILSIDTTAARQLPGVLAVITGADIDSGPWGRLIKDMCVMATDEVRFAGERVAAVAAEDEDIAQRALDLIEVKYEELPAVFDPVEALSADAPLLHPDFADYPGGKMQTELSNAYTTDIDERGDIEAGFAVADLIVENTYITQRVHQAYLEPQTVLVNVEDDMVQVWTCSKSPYDTRNALAVAARLRQESVVFHHTYVGGDFGGKQSPANMPICYFLAKLTGRPVCMINDYVEEFLATNPRSASVIKMRTGVTRDGIITAHHAQAFVNTGAYAGFKPHGVIGHVVRAGMGGPYRLGNVRLESREVYTNTVPAGHMRSPGLPQSVFASESHIDEVARELDMDPLEFRLRNIVVAGDQMPMGSHPQDLRARETLLAAANAAGYNKPKQANVGRGIAMCDRAPGGGAGTLTISLHPDGSIEIGTPIFDQGSGTYTTLTQVVAEEFAVDPSRIRLSYWRTGAIDFDSGIGGQRATRVNTAAANEATRVTKLQLLELAATYLHWPPETLVLRGDEIRRTDQEEAITWMELLRLADSTVTGQGSIDERGRHAEVTCFAAQIAEVSVDPETGEVRLLNMVTAHDTGQIVNPVGHQGQINGGLMQGIGYAMMEELQLEDGRVTTLSFGDYKIPTIADVPPLQTVFLEPGQGVGPYAIKSIGETPNVPAAAAIANAVADATGARVRDLPITAEKVYRLTH